MTPTELMALVAGDADLPDVVIVAHALEAAEQAARDYRAACDQVAELLAGSPAAITAWLAGAGE